MGIIQLLVYKPVIISMLLLLSIGYWANASAAGSTPPEEEESKSELVVFAENISLTIQPKRCLLRANKNCEVNVQLSWKADKKFDLCLREEGNDFDLACWENSVSGAIKIRFDGNKTTTYQLVDKDKKKITEVAFTVGTVAKTHRKVMSRKRRMWGFP